MHLAIEVLTLLFFAGTAAHAALWRGRLGAGMFVALLWLGFVRENWVAIRDLLYGFAPLHLVLGRAPLIATVIWSFSIWVALVWAEAVAGEPPPPWSGRRRPSARLLALGGLFMMALAGFYEPFLTLLDMARWQEGTRTTLGIPWIALVGYPTLTVGFLLVWSRAIGVRSATTRSAVLLVALAILGVSHAAGLQALKDLLGW